MNSETTAECIQNALIDILSNRMALMFQCSLIEKRKACACYENKFIYNLLSVNKQPLVGYDRLYTLKELMTHTMFEYLTENT